MEPTTELFTDVEKTASFLQKSWNSLTAWAAAFLPKLLLALIVFGVGYLVIRLAIKLLKKGLGRSKLDPSLQAFLLSLLKITLIVLLAITCASMLGLETTSLITAVGAVGLAFSLAVKDSLTNLAGGMLLLFTKPFSTGDFVSVGDISGTVSEISLVYTRLTTPDNKVVYLPNGDVSKATVVNFSSQATRRLDLTFSIGYECDFHKAEQVILKVAQQNPMVLQDPAPMVRLTAHGSSSLDILCRVWVESANYWPLNFDLLAQVKDAFDEAGISIPYPQMDVHLSK